MNKDEQNGSDFRYLLLSFGVGIPWFEIMGNLWNIGKKIMRGLSSEGIYEVLDYECELELRDKYGKSAKIRKQQTIRYLQDYVTSYQDQAWGDGKILVDYRCSPGVSVDEYRLGHKTYKLISLREFRNKGDVDTFHTEWTMRNGFLKPTGFWGTAINHRTNRIAVKVIFPKERPPIHVSLTEINLRRTRSLGNEHLETLPDGRVMIAWEHAKPRFCEEYILRWEW